MSEESISVVNTVGPAVQREVTREELSKLSDSWEIAGSEKYSGYSVSELGQRDIDEMVEAPAPSQNEGAKTTEELAAEAFQQRGGVWQEYAEEELDAKSERKSTEELMSEARSKFQQRKEELQAQEKEKAKEKAKRNAPDWAKGDTRPINELSVREYKELIAEAHSSDGSTTSELEEAIEEDIEERFNDSGFEKAELEESTPDLSEEELQDLESQGGAWASRADEIREGVKIEELDDGSMKIITEDPSHIHELEQEARSSNNVDIEEFEGGIAAKIKDPSKYA